MFHNPYNESELGTVMTMDVTSVFSWATLTLSKLLIIDALKKIQFFLGCQRKTNFWTTAKQ